MQESLYMGTELQTSGVGRSFYKQNHYQKYILLDFYLAIPDIICNFAAKV